MLFQGIKKYVQSMGRIVILLRTNWGTKSNLNDDDRLARKLKVRPALKKSAILHVAFFVMTLFGEVAENSQRVYAEDREINFNRDVRPILSDKCFQCHGPDEASRKAKLRLDDETAVKAERDGIVIVRPNDPAGSELVRRILSDDESEIMPPHESGKPLSAKEKRTLQRWIEEGATWSKHWAYEMPVRNDAPSVNDANWPRNWIDKFILSRLEFERLSPSVDADRVTLLRRVCFDLTGLPPTESMAKEFLADNSVDVYERLVDQLLSSPNYGERMAVFWLDLVRYADTVGYHGDQTQNISPYRDWVINAFNTNQPFDDFTRDQLAGDLSHNPSTDQIIATGYNRLLQTTHEGGLQAKEYRAIYAADRVRNVSAVWMGATVGCAQCHDHKFDPYTSEDFYSLSAFFADVDDETHFTAGSNANPTARDPELELPTADQKTQLADIMSRHNAAKAKLETKGMSEAELKAIRDSIKDIDAELKRLRLGFRRSMITVPLKTPRVVRILPRGNWLDESGPIVAPNVPKFMESLTDANGPRHRVNRLDLANWLVDAENVSGLLTARVMVNRLWALGFGSGLSGRLDDFGGQGEPPVHPELLDRLAHEFVESGWNVKAIMKLIVTSRTYQQSSVGRSDLLDLDPNNRLYARQSTFRRPAEMIRDNALAISGLLVPGIGGPSVKPYQPEGYYRHLNFPERTYQQDNDDQQWRRGVYVHWQRQFLHPMLKAFDAPSREECTAQRMQSNTPMAALVLLNDPTFVEAARAFAARSLANDIGTDDQRLARAFKHALTREPAVQELGVLRRLLKENRESFDMRPEDAVSFLNIGLTKPGIGHDERELAAWTAVCRAILNLAETNSRN